MYFIKKLCRYGAYLAPIILATWQFPTYSSTQTSKTSVAPAREWPTDCHNQQSSDKIQRCAKNSEDQAFSEYVQ